MGWLLLRLRQQELDQRAHVRSQRLVASLQNDVRSPQRRVDGEGRLLHALLRPPGHGAHLVAQRAMRVAL
jgi:hypothetical protein